jgi:hypothetical protein
MKVTSKKKKKKVNKKQKIKILWAKQTSFLAPYPSGFGLF